MGPVELGVRRLSIILTSMSVRVTFREMNCTTSLWKQFSCSACERSNVP